MSNLTLAEKKAIAEEEKKQAEAMIAYHRKEVDKWIKLLEVKEEYLYYLNQYQKKGLK